MVGGSRVIRAECTYNSDGALSRGGTGTFFILVGIAFLLYAAWPFIRNAYESNNAPLKTSTTPRPPRTPQPTAATPAPKPNLSSPETTAADGDSEVLKLRRELAKAEQKAAQQDKTAELERQRAAKVQRVEELTRELAEAEAKLEELKNSGDSS